MAQGDTIDEAIHVPLGEIGNGTLVTKNKDVWYSLGSTNGESGLGGVLYLATDYENNYWISFYDADHKLLTTLGSRSGVGGVYYLIDSNVNTIGAIYMRISRMSDNPFSYSFYYRLLEYEDGYSWFTPKRVPIEQDLSETLTYNKNFNFTYFEVEPGTPIDLIFTGNATANVSDDTGKYLSTNSWRADDSSLVVTCTTTTEKTLLDFRSYVTANDFPVTIPYRINIRLRYIYTDGEIYMYVGESVPFNYELYPQNATEQGVTFSVVSGGVEISPDGIITALEVGEARVRVVSNFNPSVQQFLDIHVAEKTDHKFRSIKVKDLRYGKMYLINNDE